MKILRIVFALVLGLVIGSAVNMGLVMLGSGIIAAPDGVDVTDSESIAAAIHLFEPKHFVFPFLAHAVGTLVGALSGHLLAQSHRKQIAYAIGVVFLAGGITAATMIPAPTWFIITDLVFAYIPMAVIAAALAVRIKAI